MKDEPGLYTDPNKLPFQFWQVYKNLSDAERIDFLGGLVYAICCVLERRGGITKEEFEDRFRFGLQDLDKEQDKDGHQ